MSTGAGATPTGTNPNTITVGNGTHDYAFDINNDPAFTALKNLLSAQGIGDAAHLRGAIQQALIQFGAVPNLPSDVLQNSGLDTGLTQNLAENNPFSTLKRLAQSYQDQQMATQNQLASRGILSSGETGYQLGRLGQQQGQNQYDATNSLLGNIGQFNDAYVAGRQAAAQQLAQGALTAENTAAQNNAGGGGGVTATWDPGTGTYVDPSGHHYDQSGNPIALPTNTSSGPVSAPSNIPTPAPAPAPASNSPGSGSTGFSLLNPVQPTPISGGVKVFQAQ